MSPGAEGARVLTAPFLKLEVFSKCTSVGDSYLQLSSTHTMTNTDDRMRNVSLMLVDEIHHISCMVKPTDCNMLVMAMVPNIDCTHDHCQALSR